MRTPTASPAGNKRNAAAAAGMQAPEWTISGVLWDTERNALLPAPALVLPAVPSTAAAARPSPLCYSCW